MAVEQSFPIIQIVGFRNSGKTTLMEKLISAATEEGMDVATIKHHGHGGTPEDRAEKDSVKHLRAGAFIAGVEGDGLLQIQAKRVKWTLQELVDLYRCFHPDVLLVEGFKQAPYPKVVMLREDCDWLLLQSLTNILCVISWHDFSNKNCLFPTFRLNEQEKYMDFLIMKLKTAHFH